MNTMNFDPTRGPDFPPLPATAGGDICTPPPAGAMSPAYKDALTHGTDKLLTFVVVESHMENQLHTRQGGFLSGDEVAMVKQEPESAQKMKAILELLQTKDDDAFEGFIEWLGKAEYAQVASSLLGYPDPDKGFEVAEQNGADRGPQMTREHRDILDRGADRLANFAVVNEDMENRLHTTAGGFLTEDEVARVKQEQDHIRKIKLILRFLKTKEDSAFGRFILWLIRSRCESVALPVTGDIGSGEGSGVAEEGGADQRPQMTHAKRDVLDHGACVLTDVNFVVVDEGMEDQLHTTAGGFLTEDEVVEVKQEKDPRRKMELILRLLKTKDDSAFDSFMLWLVDSGHERVAWLLIEDINYGKGSGVADEGGADRGPQVTRSRSEAAVPPRAHEASTGALAGGYYGPLAPPSSDEFPTPADDACKAQSPRENDVPGEKSTQSLAQLFCNAWQGRPVTFMEKARMVGCSAVAGSLFYAIGRTALAMSCFSPLGGLMFVYPIIRCIDGAFKSVKVVDWLDRAVTSLPDHLPGRLKDGIKGWLVRAGVPGNVDSVGSLYQELGRSGGITKRKVARLATFTAVAAVSEVALACAGFAVGGLLPFGGAAYACAFVGAASAMMYSKQLDWVERKITSFWSPRDGACAPETALAAR